MPFRPVAEPDLPGAFVTEQSLDPKRNFSMSKIPWIIGTNANEGAFRAACTTQFMSYITRTKVYRLYIITINFQLYMGNVNCN